jgi:hypothetical protein
VKVPVLIVRRLCCCAIYRETAEALLSLSRRVTCSWHPGPGIVASSMMSWDRRTSRLSLHLEAPKLLDLLLVANLDLVDRQISQTHLYPTASLPPHKYFCMSSALERSSLRSLFLPIHSLPNHLPIRTLTSHFALCCCSSSSLRAASAGSAARNRA